MMDKSVKIKETNDIDLASCLIASGVRLVRVRVAVARRSSRPECLFAFEDTAQRQYTEVMFLNNTLQGNLSILLSTKRRVLSFVSNGCRGEVETLNG